MLTKQLESCIEPSNLIYIHGGPFSGKTRLAIYLASISTRKGHVIWVCADGKTSFAQDLKRNLDKYDGKIANVTVLMPAGQRNVYDTIMDIEDFITEDTTLLVIDPITRSLDLGREATGSPWGRELIEDILPHLAGLSIKLDLTILITSEVRMNLDGDTLPILHRKMLQWADVEIRVEQGTSLFRLSVREQNGKSDSLDMRILDGIVSISDNQRKEENGCSESLYSA